MKKNKKLSSRIFAGILSFVMIISIFQTNVFALENVDNLSREIMRTTTLDCTKFSVDQNDVGEGWSWNYANKILTLSGVNISVSNGNGVKLPDNSTIVMTEGSINTIKTATMNGQEGIYATDMITINGAGTLNVESTGTDTDAIYATYGTVGGTVLITGGTVNATGGYNGISADTVTIKGTSTRVNATGKRNFGIGTKFGDLTVEGSTVTAIGNKYGCDILGNINIKVGTLTATATAAQSIGIRAADIITIVDGVLTVKGNESGINTLYGKIVAVGATVTGATETFSNGITKLLTQKDMTIPVVIVSTSDSSNTGSEGNTGVWNNNPVVVIPTTPDTVNDPTTAQIETKATVDSKGIGVVTILQSDMDNAISKALETAKKNGTQDKGIAVKFIVSTGGQTVNELILNLSKAVQEKVINNKVQEVSFIMESANITLELNLATVLEINKQAKTDVKINVKQLDTSKLKGEGKSAIGNRPVFDLTVTYNNDKSKVTDFGTGKVLIEIPYKLQKGEKSSGVKGVYVDSNGKVTYIEDTVYNTERESAIVQTNHFSVYGIGYKESTIKTDYSYGKLRLRSNSTTKTSQKLSWEKVSTADGYVVYGAPCGTIGNMEKLVEIKKNSTTTWTDKKLKSGTYYKYVVKAYKVVDGKKKLVAVSKTIHTATQGGKIYNPEAIKLNASRVNLEVNKKKKITVKVKPILDKSISKHADVKFESSNKGVATVGADGTITAKKKGNCTVYVYAQNGIYKVVNVIVK